MIHLAVSFFHGYSDPWDEFIVDEILLEPEGRVDELTHVFPVPVAPSDNVVPFFQRIYKNVNIVSPVIDSLFYAAFLEEGDEDVGEFFFKGSDLDHLFCVEELSDSVGVPVIEIKLQEVLGLVFINLSDFLLYLLILVEVKDYFQNGL